MLSLSSTFINQLINLKTCEALNSSTCLLVNSSTKKNVTFFDKRNSRNRENGGAFDALSHSPGRAFLSGFSC